MKSKGIIPLFVLMSFVGCSSFQSESHSFFKDAVLEEPPTKVIQKTQAKRKPYDPDWDFDGIAHSKDKCPFLPEDKDGYRDNDGCPDLDNDRDLVLDLVDQCPKVRGLKQFKGPNPTDWDNDGVLNKVDKCPWKKERLNGIKDNDGCPDGYALPVIRSCYTWPGTQNEYVFERDTTKLIRQEHNLSKMKRFVSKNAPLVFVQYPFWHSEGASRRLAILRGQQVLLQMKRAGFSFKMAYAVISPGQCQYGTCYTDYEDIVRVSTVKIELPLKQYLKECIAPHSWYVPIPF